MATPTPTDRTQTGFTQQTVATGYADSSGNIHLDPNSTTVQKANDAGTPSVSVGTQTMPGTVTTTGAAGASGTSPATPATVYGTPEQINALMDILAGQFAAGGGLIGQSGSGVVALPTQLTNAPASTGPTAGQIIFILILLGAAFWYYKKHQKKKAE